nr:MAG TPA: hypothetical protein [Caudoviricetes sp.]
MIYFCKLIPFTSQYILILIYSLLSLGVYFNPIVLHFFL